MSFKTFILTVVAAVSVVLFTFYCYAPEKQVIVVSKAYTTISGFADLPDGICYYEASNHWVFQDSCNKYSVGDSIIVSK
jgi:hypothetical protein